MEKAGDKIRKKKNLEKNTAITEASKERCYRVLR